MFQFSALASFAGWYTFSITGCPIRKSSDITLVCSSPKLIAAYHVLLRLLESRHPPYALICFKKITIIQPLQHFHLIFFTKKATPATEAWPIASFPSRKNKAAGLNHYYYARILRFNYNSFFPNMSKNFKNRLTVFFLKTVAILLTVRWIRTKQFPLPALLSERSMEPHPY